MSDEKYLPKMLALRDSMERFCQPYHLWVLALDDRARRILQMLPSTRLTVVALSEIESYYDSKLTECGARRRYREYWHCYVWTIKSHWINYLLTKRRLDHAYYIDGDAYFFHEPSPMYQEIGDANIAITKHNFSQPYTHCECNGTYNGGFLYVRNKPITQECLSVWMRVCREFPYGPLTDQIHLNVWPKRWNAHIVRHPGVNVAPWNYQRYTFRLRGKQVCVDNQPIIWYHFHRGLRDDIPEGSIIAKHVYRPYAEALQKAGVWLGEAQCKL